MIAPQCVLCHKVKLYELAALILKKWQIFLICNLTEWGGGHITELMGVELQKGGVSATNHLQHFAYSYYNSGPLDSIDRKEIYIRYKIMVQQQQQQKWLPVTHP